MSSACPPTHPSPPTSTLAVDAQPDLVRQPRVYGTPNYYVSSSSAATAATWCSGGGTRIPLAASGQPRFYASAARDEKAGEIIVKVVNATPEPVSASLRLNGVSKLGSKSTETILTSASLSDENSLDEPRKVAP